MKTIVHIYYIELCEQQNSCVCIKTLVYNIAIKRIIELDERIKSSSNRIRVLDSLEFG